MNFTWTPEEWLDPRVENHLPDPIWVVQCCRSARSFSPKSWQRGNSVAGGSRVTAQVHSAEAFFPSFPGKIAWCHCQGSFSELRKPSPASTNFKNQELGCESQPLDTIRVRYSPLFFFPQAAEPPPTSSPRTRRAPSARAPRHGAGLPGAHYEAHGGTWTRSDQCRGPLAETTWHHFGNFGII